MKQLISLVAGNIGTVLLIVAAYFVGVLMTENRYLKSGVGQTAAPTVQQQAQPTAPSITLDQIKELFATKGVLTFGKSDKLMFVEFSDPSCPFCHVAGGVNKELSAQVGERFKYISDGGTYEPPVPEMKKLVDAGKASFAWVYSPGHGNGELGTKALYCAYEKGKFWEAHELLMSNSGYKLLNETVKNDKTKSSVLAEFLKGVVDTKFLQDCLESGKYDDRIAADTAMSTRYGAQGTPGFYVNSTNFAGAYSWADMKSVVQSAL